MYYKQINGIRAFAVFGPLFVHLWPRNTPASNYTAAIAHMGSLGVDLFFVISGFLITGILLRNKGHIESGGSTVGKNLVTFYIRRFIRIFPIYYLLLITLFILGMAELRGHGWWYFCYLSNFRVIDLGHWPGVLSHTWSLSVEEQFYFVWPLLVLKVPQRWLPRLFLSLFLVGPVFRIIMMLLGASSMGIGVPPFACLDPLAGGALLALWMATDKSRKHYGKLRVIGIAGGICFLLQAVYYIIVLQGGPINAQLPLMRTAAAAFFAWLIGSAALERNGWLGAVFKAKVFDYIGRISYGIYLYHLVFPWVLQRTLGIQLGHSVPSFFITAALAIAVSSISWHVLEKPVNRLKRLRPSSD